MGQWLGDSQAVGVPQVAEALGNLGDTASSVTEDLTTRVGGGSDLLGALASGTQEVDQSVDDRLGLTPGLPGQAATGATGAPSGGASGAPSSGGRGLVGTSATPGAPKPDIEIMTGGDPVDVASGDIILSETDVTLPGVLPLVL